MRFELIGRLRGLYRGSQSGQAEHARALEAKMVAAFENRHPPGEVESESKRRGRLPMILFGTVLGLGAVVGACALPAEYPVSLGQGVEITLAAERWGELDPEEVARYLGDELGVERIEMHVSRSREETIGPDGALVVDEEMRLQIFALGGELDVEDTWEELRDAFPILEDAQVHAVPLAGTVHGTLGGRLSASLLDVTIDRDGVEEAERQILAQLMAEGISPENAKVEISTSEREDGHREIRIRVEAEAEAEPEP